MPKEYSVVYDITTTIPRVDFAELRKQKATLVNLRLAFAGNDDPNVKKDFKNLSGIIHFLDAFQDSAAEKTSCDIVFGKLPK